MSTRTGSILLVGVAAVVAGWLLWRPAGRGPGPAPTRPSETAEATLEGRDDAPSAPAAGAAGATAKGETRLSPEARKAMLRSLERALAQRTAARPVPPTSSPALPDKASGELDKSYIRERVREIIPLIKDCYEEGLREHSDIEGRMEVQFSIVADESVGGLVESSEVRETSTLREPSVVECVRETMYAMRFKAPVGGGRVVVNYPIIFRRVAEDGGE